jgi:hypothetical protein
LKQIDGLLSELSDFNNLKNEGFYVDNRKGFWKTPMKIDETDYNKVLKSADLIRDIFLPKIEYSLKVSNENLVLLYEAMNK